MNSVLEEILRTSRVKDHNNVPRPLLGSMSEEKGDLIIQVFEAVQPDTSVETGFAFGISTLFACAALERNGKSARHVVIDPLQKVLFEGIGLLNINRAGYDRFVELQETGSELALPQLFQAGTRLQAAIIDGYHTFDHALIDFFYINKMLDIGGVVIIDDVNMPSVARLVAHISTYPCYRVYGGTKMPRAPNPLVALRRQFNRKALSGKYSRDNPSCIALQKSAPDARDWDWHADF